MSETQTQQSDEPQRPEEVLRDVLDTYYGDEIQSIATGKRENPRLHIDIDTIDRSIPIEMRETYLDNPQEMAEIAEEVLPETDASGAVDPNVDITITDDAGFWYDPLRVADIRSEHIGEYVRVSGQLAAVTKVRSFPYITKFICQNCGSMGSVRQTPREFKEPPHGCDCEQRSPMWKVDYENTEWKDHRKLKIQQRPEEAANGETQHIAAHVTGTACDDLQGLPLVEHAGDDATVYGTVEAVQQSGRGAAEYLFSHYLDADGVTFEDTGASAVNVDEHIEEIKEHAHAPNVHERFYTSLAPQIHPTDRMELAMKLVEAFLFAAPRVDPDDGPMYRGDIHLALIGDPGMAKSVLLSGAAEFSPDAEHRSATGLSSDVGLIAAAVEDDFGEGGWTLRPGILVRAGAHAIVDEIDKGPDELEKINDALEGKQVATIDKAGIKADLKSRTGLLVSGNPRDSRFNLEEPLANQVDIEESLLTRFDAIVLLVDEPDEEQDRKVAEHITKSYQEGIDMITPESSGNDDAHTTSRTVTPEVGRAWVKAGRDITPQITDAAMSNLEDFYVDVRSQSSEDSISATARQLESGIRLSMAYARARLSETVEPQDVEMAIGVSKAMIGQTHDGSGQFDIDKLYETGAENPQTQEERKDTVRSIIESLETTEQGAGIDEILTDAQGNLNIAPAAVEKEIQNMKDKGELYEPQRGEYRLT